MTSTRGWRITPGKALAVGAAIAMAGAVNGCGDSAQGPDPSQVPTIAGPKHLPDRFQRMRYSDLTYRGAFGCPDRGSFSNAVGVLAYVPGRNTLVVVGKDTAQNWFELSIPQAVISPTNNPADLNFATDLSGWMPVMEPLHPILAPAKVTGGLTYLNGRFWVGTHQFYNVTGDDNLGISSVDENFGDHRGAWRVGPSGVNSPIGDLFHANKTHDDVMVIPQSWARVFTPGRRLAGGRHRTAGAFGGGRGPALYAFKADHTAAHGSALGGVPLMAFSDTGAWKWPNYRPADNYHSVWIWSGDRQAVVVSTMKGIGGSYYGDGPACTPPKGYHADPYEPRLNFIDVNHLGEVARGVRQPYDVLPYQTVDISDVVWGSAADPNGDPNCQVEIRDFAFDSERGLLYGSQPKAYRVSNTTNGVSNRMIIHVWQIG